MKKIINHLKENWIMHGFESISSKPLRIKIIDLYDRWYTILQTNQKTLTDDIQDLTWYSFNI